MSEIVLNRIYHLQNPDNCSTARKAICGHFLAGMGASLHHWVYCFIYAYYTNRTMLIDTSQWKYLRNVISKDGVKDFHQFFLPISKCSYTDQDKNIAVPWNNSTLMDSTDVANTPQVIRLPHIGVIYRGMPRPPKNAHYAMPEEIFYNVIKYKYKPMAWWVGFFAKYLIRPNNQLQQFIDQSRKDFQFQSPIVGLHIRRTDKAEENKLYNIDQYMNKVNAYFNSLAKRNITVKRRVFVITDEPFRISMLKKKYKNYQFIHPPLSQLKADTYTTRYSANNLKYFLRDVFLLAECDYLVITLSSNVGKVAYELHEVLYNHTLSQHYTSLDWDYQFFGHNPNDGPWIMQANQNCSNNMTDGIDLMKGDYLESCTVVNKTQDICYGYSKRLRKSGYFHQSCTTYLIDNEDYPDYSQFDISTHWNKSDDQHPTFSDTTCMKSSINDDNLI